MRKPIAYCFMLVVVLFHFACVPSQEVKKPTDTSYTKSDGKLIAPSGKQFSYLFYPSDRKGPSVILIPGLSGDTRWEGRRGGGYSLASELNKAGFNFIGFDFYGWAKCEPANLWPCIKKGLARSKSGSLMMPSPDGEESATENIARNEIQAVISFLEKVPTHDPEKGAYLIGASIGSWISLCAVHQFPDKITGVVFLSPAIVAQMWSEPEKYPNAEKYWDSLLKSFGDRPALAIGGTEDHIVLKWTESTAWDSAQFLQKEIGTNVELMKVETDKHATVLVSSNKKVRERIVGWLSRSAYQN